MRPIFNEKVPEKWGLWVPWTVHGTHLCDWKVVEKSNCAAKKKKKKKENTNAQRGRAAKHTLRANYNLPIRDLTEISVTYLRFGIWHFTYLSFDWNLSCLSVVWNLMAQVLSTWVLTEI